MELLLKRDDLCLEEIVIWDNLIKWGLAQNPSIPKDVEKWSKGQTTIMEKTLHKCIPLVDLYNMSSKEFLDIVYPFREILPKDLFNLLLVFHLAPDRFIGGSMLKFDSKLVKTQHFATFSSWIDKQDKSYYDVINMPYNFNLLYRASKDGMTSAKFHEKCDNKGATIVIVKIQNSEQIVGGYNPLVWDSISQWKSTGDSFIFSFVNRMNLQTAKVGHIIRDKYSSYCGPTYGPQFGSNGALYCYNCSWGSNASSSYPKVGIPEPKFAIDDYEVFQVIKK